MFCFVFHQQNINVLLGFGDIGLSTKLQTHFQKQLVPYVKRFVIVQTPDAEAALGRTAALLTEVHRVPRQDADEASKHLGPASLTVMDQPKT